MKYRNSFLAIFAIVFMLTGTTSCDAPYFDDAKCGDAGQDWDGDGFCKYADCDDFNPIIFPGAPCNDGDTATHDDVWTDSCTCAGI